MLHFINAKARENYQTKKQFMSQCPIFPPFFQLPSPNLFVILAKTGLLATLKNVI